MKSFLWQRWPNLLHSTVNKRHTNITLEFWESEYIYSITWVIRIMIYLIVRRYFPPTKSSYFLKLWKRRSIFLATLQTWNEFPWDFSSYWSNNIFILNLFKRWYYTFFSGNQLTNDLVDQLTNTNPM